MSEEKKGFAVADRRHFHADGRARESEQESSRPAQDQGSRIDAGKPIHGAETETETETSEAPIDFSQFLISIAAQAGSLLHAKSDDAPDEASIPEGVRHVISILEMLQDKSEGRRSPEETRLLDQLLYELRMAYIAVRRQGGA
ncbi:MAG: DUF1844 domain-containing protein [Vicinamibacteria bacterium]|nr:DUF1844 domain-containing protein [Vicinamibacteria bacterium]